MPSELKQVVTHTFTGGMNRDVSNWVLEPSMYYDALNIRILQSGQEYIVTNPLGNIEIPFTLPEGENYCLGSYGDTENNKFYWFNWNENNLHGVYMYDYTLNNVTQVLLNLVDTADIDILEFKKRSLILMIDVIKGPRGNDLIYWCDGQVKQKKFNVQKALDKSSQGYGTIVTATDINAYKLASNAPVTTYFTDTSRETNFVYGHLYKASAQWWFDDGEKNNWSEFSTVALPVNNGFTGNPAISNVNNVLQVTVETGPSIVTHINIAIKDGVNNFVSVIVLDKAKLSIPNDSTYTYSFYNDNTSYSGLDQSAVYRAYSFMPRLAALQAFCHNAMVYGKGVEGFPTVDILLTSEVLYSDLFIDSDVENELNDPLFEGVVLDHDFTRKDHGRRRNSLIKITIGNDVKEGNKFDLYGKNGESDNLFWTYTATNSDSAITVANEFKQQLVATGRILGSSPELPNTDIWVNDIDGSGNVSFEFIWRGAFDENLTAFTGQVNPVSYQTLKDNGQSVLTQKSGDSVNYGVLYWNEDTYRSNVYTSNGGFVRNDFVTQTGGFKKIDHRLSIHSVPPEWATHWELVRTTGLTYGSLPSDYIQILIQKAIESQSTTDTDYVDLIIGSLYTYQEMYPNTIVRYEFEKNDRVRLIQNTADDTYYPFIETVVLDFKEVGTTVTIDEDITTNNTNIVTIGGTTTTDNIGRFIVIDGIEREIIAAPSGTTYTLSRTFGTAEKYPSFQIIDKRGILRIRKPIGITIEDNSIIEVYKPTENVETEQKNFYLFGQKYAIQNPGTPQRSHTGNIQNQDASNPAIISITEGTTYVRNQQFPTNNSIPGTQVAVELKESQSYSDFYESSLNNNGKTAPEDDGSGEIRFGSRLRYSNNYIEGTRINGLNDFDNLDREDYNDPWGDFMLLKYRDRLLYAFKQFRVGYIGILNSIITTSDGNPSLATTTKFLNQYQTFSWEGGIGNNPESYVSDQTWQYFLSPNSGTDCRVGGDGVLPISHQFGLSQTVRSYIDTAQKYGSFIFGGFDRANSERILAFEPYKPFVYRGGFTEANWKLYDDPLPLDTVYQITTQPVNGEDSAPVDAVTIYTPDTNFVGSDPSFFRWSIGAGWSAPKKICMRVDDANIPPLPVIYYNAELTVPFVKQGCGEGYHGSTVNYVVPALKYSSAYSQESADQQAADEAAVYGQTFANENGTCEINDPNAFNFTDQVDLPLSTLIESNTITVTGSYPDYFIVITDGEYQINGGSWTSASGVIEVGDTVKIRRTTSASYNTTVSAILTIGTVSDTWNITTEEDVEPDPFTFIDVTGALLSTLYVSNMVTISGLSTGTVVAVSVSGGEYSKNGGAYTSAVGTAQNGDTFTVRLTSSASQLTAANCTLTVGTYSDTYTVTTGDFTPDPFTFTDVTDAALSTVYVSNTITISGLSSGVSVPVSVSGSYSKNGGAYTSAAGTAQNGDTFTLRVTSSGSESTPVNSSLTVGGVSDTWTVTTGDFTPNPFTFTDVTGAEVSTLYTSNTITISGLSSGVSISVSVSGAEYSKNGGGYTSSPGTAQNGDTFTLRDTSSASYSAGVSSSLTTGSYSDTWNITTRAANDVQVDWADIFGNNPVTPTALGIMRNGVDIFLVSANLSGTLPAGTFKEGDTILAFQVAYPAFRWAPSSSANLVMTNGLTTIYNDTVTDQTPVNLQQTPAYVIPGGTTLMTITSEGSSTAVGYSTLNFTSHNYLGNGEYSVDVVDNNEAGLGLQDLEPNSGDGDFSFNVSDTGTTLTVTITNNKATAIDYSLAGNGGYLKTGTIAALGNISYSDVPKDNIVVEVSDSTGGIACGIPVPYSGGQTYPSIQVITLGTGLGTVTLNFDAVNVPDKFIVVFDGVEVINTGYRGDTANQTALNAALASYGAPPETITSPGSGSANFIKLTATTTATVYVYAPMSGTAWSFTLGCPV